MNFVRGFVEEVLGLFVDDGNLALLSAILVALVAVLTKLLGVPPLGAAGLLLVGCPLILSLSVYRAATKR